MSQTINEHHIRKPKKLFWALNGIGWAVFLMVNIFFQTRYLTENFNAIYYSFIVIGVGFVMSLLVRYFILKINLITSRFFVIVLSSLLIAIVAAVISVFIYAPIIVGLGFSTAEGMTTYNIVANIFRFMTLFMVWIMIYNGFLFFEKQQNLMTQKLNLSLRLKEAELNNLRKQLSPHFLFNAINNTRSLILIDPEKARDALLNISDLLRYALNYQKKESVTVQEEMEIVESYISLNKIHLGKNAVFKVEVEEELNTLAIPPMSIQLLVENAIKHGELVKGSIVSVSVLNKANYALIEVTNPGKLTKNSTQGLGLVNLKERLSLMYPGKATVKIFQEGDQVNAQIRLT